MTSTSLERPVVPRSPRQLTGFDPLAAAAAAHPGQPGWLLEMRAHASALVRDQGLPSTKDEEWRFTSLRGLSEVASEAPPPPVVVHADLVQQLAGGFSSDPMMVFVDGIWNPALSRIGRGISGLSVRSLADAIGAGDRLVSDHLGRHVRPEDSPLAAVNAALIADGAVVDVAAGCCCLSPIVLLHLTTSGAANTIVAPRLLVVLGAGASATVVEQFASLDSTVHLTTAVAEIVLGAGARLEHVRVQNESAAAWHVGFTMVDQQRDSHYRSFTLALGGRLSRHNLHARLSAEQVETLLYGLYLTRNEQVVDNHTAIFHDQPHCNSWEVYKGVLAGHSHAIFNGKVLVAAEAQRTDAKQTNRNLLLTDTARVDTKPQLEIFADDVKCTHGATVGRLDEQQRYYLRTRGIAGREAQALLITAFVAEVTAAITDPTIRLVVDELVRTTLDEMIG